MTEQQKEAMERLDFHKDFCEMSNGCCVVNRRDVEKVLSMTKQQKIEIASLKRIHNYDLGVIENVKEEAVKLYNKIEEKKQIINLMTQQLIKLRENSAEDCFLPRNYRNIDECIKTTCEQCIKKYFKLISARKEESKDE